MVGATARYSRVRARSLFAPGARSIPVWGGIWQAQLWTRGFVKVEPRFLLHNCYRFLPMGHFPRFAITLSFKRFGDRLMFRFRALAVFFLFLFRNELFERLIKWIVFRSSNTGNVRWEDFPFERNLRRFIGGYAFGSSNEVWFSAQPILGGAMTSSSPRPLELMLLWFPGRNGIISWN